jgi:Glycosyltransferase sugar-binding region containing DXD motif
MVESRRSPYPLVHQISFSKNTERYKLKRNSTRLIEQFGINNYRLWELGDTRDFIRKNYSGEVLLAFDKLKPFSYKADLARYCIVNFYGGLYADLSVNNVHIFDTKDFDMVLFRDMNSDRTSWKVATSFFYSAPQSTILNDSIAQCVENCKLRYYGKDPHFPTGPNVLGRAVAKFGPDLNILVGQYHWFHRRKNRYVLPRNRIVARHKIGGAFLGGQSGILGGNNYNEMWSNRDIYEQ